MAGGNETNGGATVSPLLRLPFWGQVAVIWGPLGVTFVLMIALVLGWAHTPLADVPQIKADVQAHRNETTELLHVFRVQCASMARLAGADDLERECMKTRWQRDLERVGP